MSATHATQSTAPQAPVLYMALELSLATWKLAFTIGSGQKPRIRSVPAGALLRLMDEIELAKKRFGLPEGAPVISCYEAGRDGFWIHRFLYRRGNPEHRRRLRVDRGKPTQASRQVRSPRCHQAGLDAHPLAQRREKGLGRSSYPHRGRRGSAATPPRADRPEGPADRARQPDQGAVGGVGLEDRG